VPADAVEDLAAEIELQLYRLGRSEVSSEVVGELAVDGLRATDDVAYVRFASVYRKFTDLEVLVDEIERLRELKQREEERKRQLSLGL
jgi:transcriptional repressor NrdR